MNSPDEQKAEGSEQKAPEGALLAQSNGGAEIQPSTPDTQHPNAKEEAEPILYDPDKPQRIPFLMEHEGEQVVVTFELGPQTDAALIRYDKLLDQRYHQADRQETGERNAMESTDNSLDAAVWLFNDRAITAEGFGDEGEVLPDDWKDSVVKDDEKAAVIDSGYLAAQVIPLPIAKPGKRLPLNRNKTAPSTIRLKALFEGHELILTHEMGQPTAEQVARYKSIEKERWIVQGTHLNKGEIRVPAKAAKKAALYRELIVSTSGYASGRVPLHHQVIVISQHLAQEVEAVRKN